LNVGENEVNDGGADGATIELGATAPGASDGASAFGIHVVIVVVAVVLALVLVAFAVRKSAKERTDLGSTFWSLIALAASVIWWALAGEGHWQRTVLLVWLSLASFMVGCLVGFLFSSFGEEVNTFGKVRDWLVGAITAVTFVKAQNVFKVLSYFADGSSGIGLPTSISASVLYVGLGFFFMFLQRELILNVLLARSRLERGRVEGTVEAGQVAQNFLATVPTSILTGVENIEKSSRFAGTEAERLRTLLFSSDVEGFLKAADTAAAAGTLVWDVTSKAAYLHYYRIYFKTDGERRAQAELAHDWIQRALLVNPLHADLTVKQADVLATLRRYEEAVGLLEGLRRRPDAPAFVKQWLGYMYLYVDRLDDSLKMSEEYRQAFPDDNDSLFNIACAHAQRYCTLKQTGTDATAMLKSHDEALSTLEEALRREPTYATTVGTEWVKPGESFPCFKDDPRFLQIVADATALAGAAPAAAASAQSKT
jgi:tetratricopeptide (TPR) repeat protein